MIQKKGLLHFRCLGAFATALLLPALAAGPAWAGECRTGKSMDVGTELEVATKVANQKSTNTKVIVRIQDAVTDRRVEPVDDWQTILDDANGGGGRLRQSNNLNVD